MTSFAYEEEIKSLRSGAIDRIMVEFEKVPRNQEFPHRRRVREILRFNWGIHSQNSDPHYYMGIESHHVNVESCKALLGPYGYIVWRVMKERFNARGTDMAERDRKNSEEAKTCVIT